MGENTGLQPVEKPLEGEFYCPKCGREIQGMKEGVKGTCPYDDCGFQFSIKTYN